MLWFSQQKKHAIWREQTGAPVTCEVDRRPKLSVFGLAKMASSQAVPRAMAWHEPHALFFL
jgi:hypothetical protein